MKLKRIAAGAGLLFLIMLVGNGLVKGFPVGDYDRNALLTVGPVLSWNTFLGGAGAELGYGITADGSGNVYVTGGSEATWGTPIRAYGGSQDAFVAKLDAAGNIVWSTFLGGGGAECGSKIALDGSGNIYITGWCNATWGTPKRSYAGGEDGWAAKLDAAGNLLWNTFLGGSSNDYGSGIGVDGSGNAYISGWGSTSWGSPKRAHTGGYDGFTAKLDTDGNLVWNTFPGRHRRRLRLRPRLGRKPKRLCDGTDLYHLGHAHQGLHGGH